jgi:hypothetical protein
MDILWIARRVRANKFVLTFCLSIIIAAGCASREAQKRVEGAAKDWCNTIRASQVIPIYPLSADLSVGDVFLVQTPIAAQAKLYRQRGFLALDDHRYRIPITNFANVYFNSYWTNSYSKVPHPLPVLPSVAPGDTNAVTNTLAEAPRAMFPTFSFQVKASAGLSAAFPVEGVPVGLNYLRSDNITGSVSISDARTYAGDESDLREGLETWVNRETNKTMLAATAKAVSPTVVYLRVVSRVYLARAIDVSLYNANQQAGGVRAGNTPDFALLGYPTNGAPGVTTNAAGATITNTLLSAVTNLLNITQAGGGAKFTSMGSSSVTLKQTFDQLLAIGYLGFDVPVYENGAIGEPVPTFQRLQGSGLEWIHPALDARGNKKTLKKMLESNPARAIAVMTSVAETLQGNEFRSTQEKLDEFKAKFDTKPISATDTNAIKEVESVFRAFKSSTFSYLSRPYWFSWHAAPQRLYEYNYAFDHAWEAISKADAGKTTNATTSTKL